MDQLIYTNYFWSLLKNFIKGNDLIATMAVQTMKRLHNVQTYLGLSALVTWVGSGATSKLSVKKDNKCNKKT
jgi:hypothetical protein